MRVIFNTYAAGILGTIRFNIDVARGKAPIGISEDGTKLVRAKIFGAPEIIGSRILSNRVSEGRESIKLEGGESISIYYAPNTNKNHFTWRATSESQDKIQAAVPEKAAAEQIINELNHVESVYDSGKMGEYSVYKVHDPSQFEGNAYIRIKTMATNTPSGYISRAKIDSINSDGEMTNLNVTDDQIVEAGLVRNIPGLQTREAA